MGEETENLRARAAVLISTEEPASVTEQVFSLDGGNNDLVVIRVDTVDSELGNLLAFIDADSEEYPEVKAAIEGISDIDDIWFFLISEHLPSPPQNASGFITEAEYLLGERQEGVEPGRQDNSPGFNSWG